LSRDNLGVLFDMCRSLDLQLLVAAPEVARAEGNTTYRLVRHTTDDGREEVIVSGRRAVASAAEPDDTQDTLDTDTQGTPDTDAEAAQPSVPVQPEPTTLNLFDSVAERADPGE
jgi:chromosome partition protein MukB